MTGDCHARFDGSGEGKILPASLPAERSANLTQYVKVISGTAFIAIDDARRPGRTVSSGRTVTEGSNFCIAVPPGRAVAVLALTDMTRFLRQISTPDSETASSIGWDDPEIELDWPITPIPNAQPLVSCATLGSCRSRHTEGPPPASPVEVEPTDELISNGILSCYGAVADTGSETESSARSRQCAGSPAAPRSLGRSLWTSASAYVCADRTAC